MVDEYLVSEVTGIGKYVASKECTLYMRDLLIPSTSNSSIPVLMFMVIWDGSHISAGMASYHPMKYFCGTYPTCSAHLSQEGRPARGLYHFIGRKFSYLILESP